MGQLFLDFYVQNNLPAEEAFTLPLIIPVKEPGVDMVRPVAYCMIHTVGFTQHNSYRTLLTKTDEDSSGSL